METATPQNKKTADAERREARRKKTITLAELIQQLQALQKKVGPDVPVWHVEFGGITEISGAEEWEDGVVIE